MTSKALPDVSVIAGPASTELAEKIAKWLSAQLIKAELRIFLDGESKIKVGRVDTSCVVVQSTYPPADTHLMQALMMAKKCIDSGARDLCAVIPYLAYARQDRAFLEGEAISIELVAKLLKAAGVEHVITVDIHSQLATSYFSSIKSISSIPLLSDYASKMKLHRPVVVSPDAGGADRANEFSKRLKADTIVLNKSRDRMTGEVMIDEKLDMNVSGRDIILVDDMVSSGASIIKATELLRKKGASKVFAMCAHALLIGDAARRISAAGVNDIIATNSIPSEYAKVDLSLSLADSIRHHYRSA